MTTTKAFILVAALLATIAFVVYGYRAVKANEKKSFDNTGGATDKTAPTVLEYSFKDIVNSITNPAKA